MHAAVTDFDDFMKIPPCATGTHSLEPAEPLKPVADASAPAPSSTSADGKELYGAAASASTKPASDLPPLPPAPKLAHQDAVKMPKSTEYVEEQDDPDVELKHGMRCKRKACGAEFEEQEREAGECTYHPGVVCPARSLPPPRSLTARELTHLSHSLAAHLPRGLEGLLVLQAAGARV